MFQNPLYVKCYCSLLFEAIKWQRRDQALFFFDWWEVDRIWRNDENLRSLAVVRKLARFARSFNCLVRRPFVRPRFSSFYALSSSFFPNFYFFFSFPSRMPRKNPTRTYTTVVVTDHERRVLFRIEVADYYLDASDSRIILSPTYT